MPRSNHSSSTLSAPSATLRCRMPAEWEPHAATWLAWPHYHGDWPGKFEPIPWVYTEIIRNLARHERVELIVNDAKAQRHVRKLLARADALSTNVRFHRWPTNRVWLRDSGCIFVVPAEPGFARPDSRGRLSPHEHLRELRRYWFVGFFRRTMVNSALQVLVGSSKAEPSRSPWEARKKSGCLGFSGRPMKRALPSALVPTSRSSL